MTEEQPNPKSERPGLRFTSVGDLLDEPDEAEEWLVDNLLIRNGASLLVAKPKVGKSTLAQHIAKAVSKGEEVLGRKTTQAPVLYLAIEDIRRRVKIRFRILGSAREDPLHIHTGKVGSRPVEELLAMMALHEPGLIVIDPLFKFIKIKEEGAYAEGSRAMEEIVDVARSTGAHILFVHHGRKGEGEGAEMSLGSTAYVGSVDATIMLRKDPSTGRRYLTTEFRYGEDWPETVIELDDTTGEVKIAGTKSDLNKEDAKDKTLAILLDEPEGLTKATLYEKVGGRREVAVAALHELRESGEVVSPGGKKRGGLVYHQAHDPTLEGTDDGDGS